MARLYVFPADRAGSITEEFVFISLEIEALDVLRRDILCAVQNSHYAQTDFIEFFEVAYGIIKHSMYYGLCSPENIKSLVFELAADHFDTDTYCGTYLDEYAEQLYSRCYEEASEDTAIEMMPLEDLARFVRSTADRANRIFDVSPRALQEISYKAFKMVSMVSVVEERPKVNVGCVPV